MTRALRALLVLAALLLPGRAPAEEQRREVVSPDFAALLDASGIRVEARPLEGETAAEFAARISADERTAERLLNGPYPPSRGRPALLPYATLSGEARLAAVRALFPSDVRATRGWLHIAVEDESLERIAEWFTGTAANAPQLAAANGLAGPTVFRGVQVTIPAELLDRPFRDAEPVPDEEPPGLEYGSDAKGRYAVYRLRKGEALYSAVVVRFTGRLHASDVIELALRIALRSGIDDVHAIPVGFPVKIPLDYLTEEYLPADDPRAIAHEKERAETAQFSGAAKARGLEGVRVVIDAGHGGRDTGTLHRGVWEATYAYDVASRLRKVLLETTRADVVMLTREPGLEWKIVDRDRLPDLKTRHLLTDPPYPLEDPVAGVNLRCYLASAQLRRPGPDRKPVAPEKTVFVSIHADSLHPSVRGAMIYVPGERFLRSSFGKTGAFYRTFREVREEPVISFTRKERVLSEGVSTTLAEKLIASIRRHDLPVHRFSPVRTHVIRGGREWVPAVLRYNKIPNRVLVEIANLANDDDRSLTMTRAFRQTMAESLAEGLLSFFGGPGPRDGRPAPLATPAPAAAAPAGLAEPGRAGADAGALPEVQGPWPRVEGPWPERPRLHGARRPRPAPAPRPTPKRRRRVAPRR